MHGYPRPQLQREQWVSLNGPWDFAIDPDRAGPRPGRWRGAAPSTCRFARDAGERHRRHRLLRRPAGTAAAFDAPRLDARRAPAAALRRRRLRGDRLGQRRPGGAPRGRLHAVLRRHHAAHPRPDGDARVVVRAEDDPHDLAKPRGKQDWQLEPHSIWYPRTTGIWQTVWLETRAGDLDRRARAGRRTSSAGRSASRRGSAGERRDGLRLGVQLTRRRPAARRRHLSGRRRRGAPRASRSPTPASTTTATSCSGARRTPTLIDAELAAVGRSRRAARRGRQLHRAARRSPSQGDRFVLNGRPYHAAPGARPGLLAGDAA